jgi:hypothetical protein
MSHLRSRNNFKVIFKIRAGACPIVLCFHAGSLDVGDAPTSLVESLINLTNEVVQLPQPILICLKEKGKGE